MPVLLLSGFLGSGKTTLVNAMLRDPRLAGTAVAVNEFGTIPIDHDLIDHGEDQTIVLANGCLCCNLAGDLESAMMRLFTRRRDGSVPRFDRLIVEPSGLSDPAPIAQAILRNPMMARVMRFAGIVTLVDAQFGQAQLARHPETRKQVALAETILLTKTDLVAGTGPLAAAVRDINATAPILTAEQGLIDPGRLFPADFLHPGLPPVPRSLLAADPADTAHTGRFEAAALTADVPLDWRRFEAWLKSIRLTHADDLLRVKGILHVAGVDGPVVVQGVHHVINHPVALDAWPSPDRRSRLVLIADPGTIRQARKSWAAALSDLVAT
ncbi:MAG TPA: GTP-binding protein [Rhodopila sp.]|uniref:CobW family GTP-binding protein n=1 Tax=Rhodopila sp. TaxID=2480087 RepID=UPI002B63211F|nr:GTP-binding protein [Rhodopila sp.]HVY17642.1 GTP-binding protein [Rhodopila sp.]